MASAQPGKAPINDNCSITKTKEFNHDRPVDFLNELPYDVLITTLNQLTTEELVELLYVCKSWRKRVVDCSEVWKYIMLSLDDANAVLKSPKLLFDRPISPHVQQLGLRLPSLSNWYDTLLTRMAQGLFPRLEVLQLNALLLQTTDTLMLALGEVANTLKELLLTTEHNTHAAFIPFCTVLSICHRLKRFIYTHDAEILSSVNFGQMPTHALQLTDFNFSVYYTPENTDSTMATLLQHCTHLQRLTLTCNDGDQVLPTIQQHCKKLEYLMLHDILSYRARPSTTTITSGQNDPDVPSSSLKLHSAAILSPLECADIMIPYLARSTETLVELYINLRPAAVPTWDPLLTLELPNLRHLTLSFEEVDDNGFVADLITHLPLLEEVHFEECEYIGFNVFNALARLEALKSLNMEGVIGAEEDSLADLFLTFSQRGVDGPLKSVTFDTCHDFIDTCDVLESLADVESVQEIRIRDCTLITEANMVQFCDKLQRHPSISILEFNRLGSVTDQALSSLSAIEHLSKLELYQLGHITDEGISDLKVANSKIELDIQDCGLLSGSTPTMFHGI